MENLLHIMIDAMSRCLEEVDRNGSFYALFQQSRYAAPNPNMIPRAKEVETRPLLMSDGRRIIDGSGSNITLSNHWGRLNEEMEIGVSCKRGKCRWLMIHEGSLKFQLSPRRIYP